MTDDVNGDLLQQLRSLFKHHEKRSWQSYVDDQLVGAGLKSGAIIGLDGNTWATSPGFGLKPGEGRTIVALFENPQKVFANGVTVNGVKYVGIKVTIS
ncbi:unnamed protein product [Rotaria sordida]|uniref:Profilin n=1 Tax=Rotaria sordida TaxID=392033 RepID=A0A814I461_9BILA|nr:unnamed protein product [Rotaria sordida]